MSLLQICRYNHTDVSDVVFTDSVSTTGGFSIAVFSGAILLVSATSTGLPVTLTFIGKETLESADSFVCADSTNNIVTMNVQAGRCYQVPDELFAVGYVMATCGSVGETVTCRVQTKG